MTDPDQRRAAAFRDVRPTDWKEAMTVTKIFTVAHVPTELEQAWLQHLRDFDVAHPGCHFEVALEPPPDVPIADMVEMLRINPSLTFTKIFERKP